MEKEIKPIERMTPSEVGKILHTNAETGKAISRTIYKFDIYRIPTIYRDNLEKELSTAKGYKTWINFAKEQYAKQIVDIPDVDRISALEQAIMEIGEVLGNG